MSSPSAIADTAKPGKTPHIREPRRFLLLILVLLVAGAAIVWQIVLNRQPNVPVSGRPLSSSQTHLHTVVISGKPGVVYLGTHFGLFTSIDGGHTWPQSQGALNTMMITAIAVSPTNPNLLAVLAIPDGSAGGKTGIYVSSDAGKSWHFTLPANLPSSMFPYTIQGAAGAAGHFYVFLSLAGWFETQDLGQHWQAITSGPLKNIQHPSLLIDPTNPQHLLMGGDLGLFETTNDGQNWQQISDVQGSVTSLSATTPASGRAWTILCATDQGLYRQQNQALFTRINSLPASSPPTSVLAATDGSALYAVIGTDLWFSPDLGTTWARHWHFTRSDLVSLVLDPQNPQELLAGFFWPGQVLTSRDEGESWQTLTA